ncbi:MAG: Hint domain-containing protein [Paracoccaceae bacterium]|nr:Hint domain-containing protein [Paracoccaceae bacterium]
MPKDIAFTKAGPVGLVTGANLRTPCGARRVENIRVGDLVVTRDAGLQPVRVVFSRTVTAAELAADPSLAPVRLSARAIAPMMPAQDLRVAPGHRLLIPGWRLEDKADNEMTLLPARELAGVNDTIHTVREAGDVTYFNIVFDEHVVFCANGMPVESFRPTPAALDAIDRNVGDDITRLFPSLKERPETYPAARYPMAEHARYRPDFA